MGYFKGLTESSFKELKNGKVIFYPYGKFGSGYELSKEDGEKTRKFTNLYTAVTMMVNLAAIMAFYYYALILLLIEVPVYYVVVGRYMAKGKKTKENMTFLERLENMGKSMGKVTSVLLVVCGVVTTAASVYCITIPGGMLIGIIGVLFFGFGLVISLLILRTAFKSHN